ncbi:MAG: DUF354 domain-containing protein [Pyrobaculum sp.]
MSTTRALSDALTPKQARIAAILYHEGRRRGVEVVITCRHYLHLADMLDMYNVPYSCIGKHGVELREKLAAGLERQIKLVDIGASVDGMVGFPSPDAARVVFGLGKAVVVLNDTPHAVHVNKLVLPLAEVLIAPQAVPEGEWKRFCPGRIAIFNGVFEYMWTSRFEPKVGEVKRLGLEPGGYVVFRPEESHAAYYRWNSIELRKKLVDEIRKRGFEVVNMPRYGDQMVEGVINIERAVDHLQLAYFSAAVITGGATMATEAALLGVPALSYFPTPYYIDRYLQEVGAPLYRCKDVETCLAALPTVLEAGRGGAVRLEDPTGVIFEVLENVMK